MFQKLKRLISARPYSFYYLIFLLPWLCFYALEYYTHDPWSMAVTSQLINYGILFFFGLGLTLLTDSLLPALLLEVVYALGAGILNYFVMDCRGNPVLPWDIYSIQTALSVSDNYSFKLNTRFYLSTGLLLLALVTGLIAAWSYRKHRRQGQTKGKRQLLPGLISCLLCLGLALSMMSPSVTSALLTPTNLFTQWASYRDNGFTVTFIENLQYMKISRPQGYKKDMLMQELTEYLEEENLQKVNEAETEEADDVQENTQLPEQINAQTPEQPSIFVIMDEAFSDLSVLHDFDCNQDYMPYLNQLRQDQSGHVSCGNLFVSVCGGNTANTEFEFLTGNSLAYLPSGSVAYQQYIHGALPSLASSLAGQGYQTAGLHPFGGLGWNRNKVYPWLGFDTTLFREQFAGSRILRKYISDASAMDKLKELYQVRQSMSQDPLFAFEVTMQNHGGYTEVFDDCPNEVQLLGSNHPYARYTSQYMTLIRKTDQALKDFLGWVDEQDSPILVIFFGDHQPNDYVAEAIVSMTGLKKDEIGLEDAQKRYIVPYLIYANYQLPASVQPGETLSANFLGAKVAVLAGAELTLYQKFLLAMKEKLPVITANVVIDKDGNYMTMEEARKQYDKELSLYEKLQYCYLFDHGADTGLFQ